MQDNDLRYPTGGHWFLSELLEPLAHWSASIPASSEQRVDSKLCREEKVLGLCLSRPQPPVVLLRAMNHKTPAASWVQGQ